MSKNWRLYAQHILDVIDKVERIRQRGDITEDDILYDAALRNLQTLSEATQRLPDSKKSRYPDIPWRQISGFRNILVHDYLGNIDPVTITRVIDQHLQPLAKATREMLAKDSESQDDS
ncbi:HepT-like ribonuclease domain-containing protein [Halomonas cerina]|uniref:Uncharacterized protein with HEPN domain n=1 Tax=Halomonas cerina TaxID=447424 RepID=A0A839VIH5_9GAMM|nr:HepT-like ribonuclease domain-containing protein [Halomonas cerina]MBB3192186.1 uncharacterized protein with HEPN domain [Halomonas cerina]